MNQQYAKRCRRVALIVARVVFFSAFVAVTGLLLKQRLSEPAQPCPRGWLTFDCFCYSSAYRGNYLEAERVCATLRATPPIVLQEHVSLVTLLLHKETFWVYPAVRMPERMAPTWGHTLATVMGAETQCLVSRFSVVHYGNCNDTNVDIVCARPFFS